MIGKENRIDIDGRTETSMLYTESQAVASGGDLFVRLGLGNCGPTLIGFDPDEPLDFVCADGSGSGNGYVTIEDVVDAGETGGGETGGGETGGSGGPYFVSIEDGALVLNGHFPLLGGMSATSAGGHLSQEVSTIPGLGEIPRISPFPPRFCCVYRI